MLYILNVVADSIRKISDVVSPPVIIGSQGKENIFDRDHPGRSIHCPGLAKRFADKNLSQPADLFQA